MSSAKRAKAKPKPAPSPWRNRIVATGERAASEFAANPLNARRHPAGQREALRGILAEVGWVTGVVENVTTGRLIDGHARIEEALGIGPDTPVPFIQVELSEDEERLMLASLDPLGALATYDRDSLEALLREVNSDSAAVQQMLADLAANNGLQVGGEPPADPGPQIDRAAELQEKWKVERGQIWEIGRHRLMCGDSTNAEDVRRLMGGEKAQIVFTDPPYGVGYDGGTVPRKELIGDESTDLYAPACQMAKRFSDDRAALYLWHAGVKGIAAAASAAAAGYDIRCEIVWNKNQAQFGALSAQYKQKHEPLYYCVKRGTPPRWFGPTNEVTVWDCDRSLLNEHHPTQKPPSLAIRALTNSSEADDIVLDLFVGGGATLVGAEQSQRTCYGLEIEPEYCAVTLERLAQMNLTPRLIN
jgi:DNA modification methylase